MCVRVCLILHPSLSIPISLPSHAPALAVYLFLFPVLSLCIPHRRGLSCSMAADTSFETSTMGGRSTSSSSLASMDSRGSGESAEELDVAALPGALDAHDSSSRNVLWMHRLPAYRGRVRSLLHHALQDSQVECAASFTMLCKSSRCMHCTPTHLIVKGSVGLLYSPPSLFLAATPSPARALLG